MLAVKGVLADHDTQTYHLSPHVDLCFDVSFFVSRGSKFWLYQTQGLFIICTPVTDVAENS